MLAASDVAPQHAQHFAPRPLPLFLDMVRRVALTDPALAARALAGLRRYGAARRDCHRAERAAFELGPVQACAAGEAGPLAVLVPSLINPAWIMDLDADRSLLQWLGRQGFRAVLIDWGAPQAGHRDRDLSDHVTERLIPALQALGEPVHLVGYCLGGVLAMAAATLHPVRSLTLIATPWHFSRYGEAARSGLGHLWQGAQAQVDALGVLPMEVLQSAFWSLDPHRSVAKFAALAELADDDPRLVAFARLEDWANAGAPLTAAAGRDLFETLVDRDDSGRGRWHAGGARIDPGTLPCPVHQLTAADDRIAPAACAAQGIGTTPCPSGHVGMMVGRHAEAGCWRPLARWLGNA